jgi:hypothetical protein
VILIALVLVVTTVALAVGVLWSTLFGDASSASGAGRPSRDVGPGAPAQRAPADAYVGHRWSGRRPRLELTESGIRGTGHQVRFCLDCPAEKSEEQP